MLLVCSCEVGCLSHVLASYPSDMGELGPKKRAGCVFWWLEIEFLHFKVLYLSTSSSSLGQFPEDGSHAPLHLLGLAILTVESADNR